MAAVSIFLAMRYFSFEILNRKKTPTYKANELKHGCASEDWVETIDQAAYRYGYR